MYRLRRAWQARGLTATVAAVALCALAGPTADAAARAQGRPADRIAFARVTTTVAGLPRHDIYVMKVNGADQRRLTRTPDDESDPAWSPDGRRLAFTRSPKPYGAKRDVFVMNADGTGVRRLTNDGSSDDPSWSPDGRRIAYTTWTGGGAIVIVDADGGSSGRVLTDTGDSWGPAWSPDGRRLAFASNRDAWKDPDFWSDLYVMPADGGGASRLTDDGGSYDPAWSPDGRRIAFTTGRTLSMMRPSGAEKRSVSTLLDAPRSPSWSPDGRRIVFEASLASRQKPRILVMNADGTGMRTLAVNSGSPAWSAGQ